MHARAAAKFVHLATRYQSRVRVARDGAGDGRQEHHGHPAAGGGARHDASRSPPTAPTSGDAVEALVGAGRVRLRRGRMQRLNGIGVSPGVVSRPRGDPDPAGAGAALPDRAGARRPRARAARGEPRRARASSWSTSARAWRAARPRAGVAVRRAAADARRPDAGPARGRHRPRAARQRRVGGAAGLRRVQRRVRRGRRSVPARAEGRRRRPRRAGSR